jgi:hypothetical protein
MIEKKIYTNLFNNKVNPTARTRNKMAKFYNKATLLDKDKMWYLCTFTMYLFK